jgi:alpha-acetolactate decarboxylase
LYNHRVEAAEIMAVNNIYQFSILGALMDGICQTGIRLQDILSHGDHGLGTVSSLNGEIVIVDGEAYHFPPGQELRMVGVSDVIPFVMVTRFRPTVEKTLSSLTMNSLPHALEPLLPFRQNCFLSIRVDGQFKNIMFRVMAAQSKPRESLVDLAKEQKVVTSSSIEGILFGFWSPAFSGSFSVAGFHLHFLSKDKSQGGHVLGFDASQVKLQAAIIAEYSVELPQSEEFNEEPIKSSQDAELHSVEGC